MSEYYHAIPRPASSSRGNRYAAPSDSNKTLYQWRPNNAQTKEPVLATIARVAMRLVSRTGEAYTAEETRPAPGTPVHGVKATLSTNLANATNNDLTYTAKAAGVAGNDITIEYVIDGVGSAVASVVVTGTSIVVTAGSATLASSVKTAIEAEAAADDLVDVANKSANDGTGVINTLAETALASGVDATAARAGQVLYDNTNVYYALTDVAITSLSGWRKVAHSAL